MIKIFHLSDIHFASNNDFRKAYFKRMLQSMPSLEQEDILFILLSGDLTHDGKKKSYNVVRDMLDFLKEELGSISFKNFHFIMVPGNHDMNFNVNNDYMSNDDYNEIFSSHNIPYDYIECENELLQDFFNLSTENELVWNDNTHIVKKYKHNDKYIKFNLINTALFSRMEPIDYGKHFVTTDTLDYLSLNKEEDLVITVMHHPVDWFLDRQKLELTNLFNQNTDILITGHEHTPNTSKTIKSQEEEYIYIRGGKLSDRGNWDTSEFNFISIDIDARNVQVNTYVHNMQNLEYTEMESITHSMSRREWRLSPQESFIESFKKINLFSTNEYYDDTFVFPNLELEVKQKNSNKEIVKNIEEFLETLNEDSKTIILSGEKSFGKSVLAKEIFFKTLNDYYVIFLESEDIRNSNFPLIIKHKFEEIYGSDAKKYKRFTSADVKDKVIIIDDFDNVDNDLHSKLVEYLNGTFQKRIFLKSSNSDMDLISKFETEYRFVDVTQYRIKPFYGIKRRELIEQCLFNKYSSNDEIKVKVSQIDDSLQKQRSFFGYEPEFIKNFARYFTERELVTIDNHISDNIYSVVFENGLNSQLIKYSKELNLDIFYILISDIAYYSFVEQNEISMSFIESVVNEFNEIHDEEIPAIRVFNIAIQSNIISEKESKLYFTSRDQYAYFIAKKISRSYKNDEIIKDSIKFVVEYAFDDFYSSILMFLTYLNQDIGIMETVLNELLSFTSSWQTFCLEEQVPFLKKSSEYLNVKYVKPTQSEKDVRKQQDELRDKEKSELAFSNDNDRVSVYSKDRKLTQSEEIARAMSLINTISRVLPNFHYMLDKSKKEKFTRAIYEIPNMIYFSWVNFIDKHIDDYVNLFALILKGMDRKNKKTDEYYSRVALEFITNASLTVYLNILSSTAFASANTNTLRHLENYKDSNKGTHSIMFLLMLEKMKSTDRFVTTALEIKDNKGSFTSRYLVNRITHHYLLTNDDLTSSETKSITDKLLGSSRTSKYFSPKDNSKKYLVAKSKIKKEK